MKTISIMIPCYNEEENVRPICDAVRKVMQEDLPQYNYEILFIDNKSKDKTRSILREMCREDPRVKAIFNMKNFGQFNSPYYGLCQTTGDCTILLCCDFQDPVELIPVMVHEWEKGHKVISMIKTTSKENHLIYWLRSIYYKTIRAMSSVEQIEHFTGFGLYDRSFIDVLRELKDPTPFLRGIVAEYASYTKGGLRAATFGGFLISGISFIIALFYLIQKLLYWDKFVAGNAPILIGVFFLGGVQMFFIGLLGEYIMSMNTRVINRPLVIEEERINFSNKKVNQQIRKQENGQQSMR